ncbi:hypothetical protein PHJA_002136600 [Phtheirospermum japonicum]|uniref:Uncharacterized protein n=1 Tax=Phtheirospermum japonicum TaxID=374723 RepID=A0A830CXX0_9LAMI|nr:hypothetical protein PHJA_002136600 [Phtheirospermum japonicum]
MERAQNPASSKGSPEDVSDTFTYATLNILVSCFKKGPKSTNIEQALIKDPVFSGFMEDYLNQGTELLTEHDAIFRGSLGKFTRNKRVKIYVGEEAIMPDGSGNKGETNVDEATSVDMLEELDEAEATDVGTDQADDDGTDVDETDDDKVDEDMDKHDVEQVLVPVTFSPIKQNMDVTKWGTMSMCDAERQLLANALLDVSNEYYSLGANVLSLYDGAAPPDANAYRQLVGGLQYLLLTHPDIAFVINKLSMFMHAPLEFHWGSLYCFLAPTLSLRFLRNNDQSLDLQLRPNIEPLLLQLQTSYGSSLYFLTSMCHLPLLRVSHVSSADQLDDELTNPLSRHWLRLLMVKISASKDHYLEGAY